MLNKIISFIAVAVLSGTVSANVQAATVTVHKGDTLWGLSHVHNTTVENIQKLNHITTDHIEPGEVLTISQDQPYIVKQGDNLWDIAQKHHVTIEQIKEWNSLVTDLIHPGLTLSLYDGSNTQTQAKPLAVPAPKEAPAVQPAPPAPKAAPAPQVKAARQITVTATAYTASCAGCSGTTATGINIKANPNAKVIAVDPSVIPLGSRVYVEGIGEAIAGDTGGAIKGNRIDVFIPSEQDALNFGVKQLKVTILN